MFKRIEHVGISVKDVDGAIAWYRDVVGAEVVLDREFGDELGRIIGVEGTRARIVHMRFGDGMIELFGYVHPQGRERRADFGPADYGFTHLGFIVEDFWATYRDLRERGVRFLGEPVEIRPNVLCAYFYGFEGEILEIKEITG